nr:hypothetical protein CFP56_25395 [Quercus suber]
MNGFILESPDSFIESLVQRVNCGRFRFELGGSSIGPSILPDQAVTNQSQNVDPNCINNQEKGHGVVTTNPSPHAILSSASPDYHMEGMVSDLSPFELLTLGLGPPLPNTPEPTSAANIIPKEDTLSDNSRKRLRKEIEKFGRNIRQRLCCGFFDKESQPVVSIL